MQAKYVHLIATVAEAGSLGAAAEKLKKSQPAVSKALQAAEAEMGVRLFQRSPAGVVPTVEGQRVVDRCRKIRRDLDHLSEDVAQLKGDLGGTLNLAVSPLAAVRIVPNVMRRFVRRYPQVQVQIIAGHSSEAFKLLRNGVVDYVLGPGPGAGEAMGLRSKNLVRTGITFITGRTSRYRDETDPAVLQSAPWLMIGQRSKRPQFFDFFETHGLESPVPLICSESILTIMSLIEGSDFLCSFPAQLFDHMAEKWAIQELAVSSEVPGLTLTLTADIDRVPTTAALAFEDTVLAVTEQMRREDHNLELCV